MRKFLLMSVLAAGFFAMSPHAKAENLGVCPYAYTINKETLPSGIQVLSWDPSSVKKNAPEASFKEAKYPDPLLEVVWCLYDYQGSEVKFRLLIPRKYNPYSCGFNNSSKKKSCVAGREDCVITCSKR